MVDHDLAFYERYGYMISNTAYDKDRLKQSLVTSLDVCRAGHDRHRGCSRESGAAVPPPLVALMDRVFQTRPGLTEF